MEEDINRENRRNEFIELAKNVRIEMPYTIMWIGDLMHSSSFLQLKKYSCELLSFAVGLFEGDELNVAEKITIAYAIWFAEFNLFRYFFRDFARSFKNGNIDGETFERMLLIIILDDLDLHVIRNHRDPIIREALRIILGTNGISRDSRELIREILRGSTWRGLQRIQRIVEGRSVN